MSVENMSRREKDLLIEAVMLRAGFQMAQREAQFQLNYERPE